MPQATDITGKTALVTGASGTIGAAIAVTLAGAGARVALQYNTTRPAQVLQRIQALGGTAMAVQADLNHAGFETTLLADISQNLGPPDILINCAANQDTAMLADMSGAAFSKMLNTNTSAVFALSRAFAAQVNRAATIVNISSIEATRPATAHGAYATSKAALEMLTKAMALEFGPKGLRVNAIAPGLIARAGIEQDWPQGVENWRNSCPLGRMGRPEDVANAALFLASPAADFITGTTVTVDGGMSVAPSW